MARTGTTAGILATLAQLADDPEVHGIILQTPLPAGANLAAHAAAIPPAKRTWTVRGPESIGRLAGRARPRSLPPRRRRCSRCSITTAWNCAASTRWWWGARWWSGKPGRAPAARPECHGHHLPLAYRGPAGRHPPGRRACRLGEPGCGLIGPGHVSPGTTVIDVGTNPTAGGGLAGDVDPAVARVAAALTPGARRRRARSPQRRCCSATWSRPPRRPSPAPAELPNHVDCAVHHARPTVDRAIDMSGTNQTAHG